MIGQTDCDLTLNLAVTARLGSGAPRPLIVVIGSNSVVATVRGRFPGFQVIEFSQWDGVESPSGVVAALMDASALKDWTDWISSSSLPELKGALFMDVTIASDLNAHGPEVPKPSLTCRTLIGGHLLYFRVSMARKGAPQSFIVRCIETSADLGDLLAGSQTLASDGFIAALEHELMLVDADLLTVSACEAFRIAIGDATVQPGAAAATHAQTGSGYGALARRLSLELEAERQAYEEHRIRLEGDAIEQVQRSRQRELDALEIAENAMRLAGELLAGVRATTTSKSWRAVIQLRRAKNAGRAINPLRDLEMLANSAKVGLNESLVRIHANSMVLNPMFQRPRGPLVSASSDPVYVQDKHFVQLSPIPWRTALFQRPQHISVGMARIGITSTYSTIYGTDVDQGIPGTSPFPGVRVASLEEAVGASHSGVVYSFYSTDLSITWQTLQSLRRLGNTIVYEYIDEISDDISEFADDLKYRHNYLISPATVDIVVTSSRALHEEMLGRFPRDRVVLIPNGVDHHHYWKTGNDSVDWAAFKRRFPNVEPFKPLVGYFGAIAPWLDEELIREVSQRLPDVEFLFIGPTYATGSEARLPLDLPNVHWSGPVAYEALPPIARAFDAAWIPFRQGEIARTTSPLKLYEYLALGLVPVSPIWMPECTALDVVQVGHDADSISAALLTAIEMKTDGQVQRRLGTLALENSWESRAETLAAVLELHGVWPTRLHVKKREVTE